jgi:formylmethanofuran dehydrogenase subunit E
MAGAAFAAMLCILNPAHAETPEEWIALGTRVHGGFGAFIPLGIRIGEDAVKRLGATGRELSVTYYDSATSPCACFADGIAISTRTSVGQRNLQIAPEKAPADTLAVVVVSRKSDGKQARYTVPASALPRLGLINRDQPEPRQRWEAVARDDTLFAVQDGP